MANTLHGPFVKGASLGTGSYGTGVGQSNTYTSGNANNDETQAAVALSSLNPHLISAGFVLTGATCTKDGTNANQLDIASGEAWLIQADGTLALCDIAADNTHTTGGNPSTTLFLDLNPDGSWSFGTSHSAVTNHLTICTVTTDASSNISSVTDTRPLNVELLTAMAANGNAYVDLMALGILAPDLGAGKRASMGHLDNTNGVFSNAVFFNAPNTGAAVQGFYFASWNGSAIQIPLSLGGDFAGAAAWIGGLGNIGKVGGQASAGSFGVPVIVAQALDVHVTATTLQTILSYTPSVTGLYRASIHISNGNSISSAISTGANYTDPHLGTPHAAVATTAYGWATDAPLKLDGTTAINAGVSLPGLPIVMWAKAASPITVTYTSPSGTPNDWVSALIERLS